MIIERIVKLALLPLVGTFLVVLLIIQMRGQLDGAAPKTRAAATPAARPSPISAGRDTSAVIAEGRVVTYPGAEVTVSTDVGGTISNIAVNEKQRVRQGELLAQLNTDELTASLNHQRARISENDAELRYSDQEIKRAEQLFNAQMGTRQALDKVNRDRDAAQARKQTAIAATRQIEAQLGKMRIHSPIDGVVISRHANRGETVNAGAPLVTIANLDRLRVEAEVDEYDTAKVTLGAPVRIKAEGFAGPGWRGHVEEIPDAVVPRRLRPQDPGRPSDTRVLLVKVALDEPTPLKLGQRVEVEISPQKAQ